MSRQDQIAKAREVDEQVAKLWDVYWGVMAKVREHQSEIKSAKKWIGQGYDKRGHYAERLKEHEAAVEALKPELNAAKQAAVDFDKEHYEGWTRFFLVQHIHNTQHCPSFRWNTRVGWLPNVSGLTEEEAVKEYGATLCTKCFPSAPVHLTQAVADPSVCPGSGQHYNPDKLTGRERSYYSPAGYCPVCDEWVGLTARYSTKIRKHKKKGA